MGRVEPPPRCGLSCPNCGTALEPLADGTSLPGDTRRMSCPDCGETFRARRRGRGEAEGRTRERTQARAADPPPVGSLSLFWRGWTLRVVERLYRTGVL